MQLEWLSSLPVPVITLGMFALMLLSSLGGRLAHRLPRLARNPKCAESEGSIAHEGYALGATLALLGLLLAFSFGMVLNRYEARRDLAINEANAIGTAYL